MTAEQLQFLITLLSAIAALFVAGGTFMWFVAEQFKKSRGEMWKAVTALHNTVTDLVANHEIKDDHRFKETSDDIWELKLAIARGNGETLPVRRPSNGNI